MSTPFECNQTGFVDLESVAEDWVVTTVTRAPARALASASAVTERAVPP